MGVLTSKNDIKRLSIKLGECLGQYLTALVYPDKLKIVWKEYGVAKKEIWVLWKSFPDDKIARKSHDRNMTMENMGKIMKWEQWSIQEGVDLRQIIIRNNKQSVLKVEITDFITGLTTTMYTQEKNVAAATK